MTFVIEDKVLQAQEDLLFSFTTRNPETTPAFMDNYWHIQHLRGSGDSVVIRSTHAHKGWAMNSQLANVRIDLVGDLLAAGSNSDIEITFTPVTAAETLQIEARLPVEFDFASATAPPYEVGRDTNNNFMYINQLGLLPGIPITILIQTVKLGRPGGTTEWYLTTFADDTHSVEGKRDELQGGIGFRLPGSVNVIKASLRSQYEEMSDQEPVRSLFRARVDEEAWAVFEFSVSMAVFARQKLIIECLGDQGGYRLIHGTSGETFILVGTDRVGTQVAQLDGRPNELIATLAPTRPETERVLAPDTFYQLEVLVRPVSGLTTWKISTTDERALPTNTNDGQQPGFNPVAAMSLQIAAQRTPPRALVEITLLVNPGSAEVNNIMLIAPPGFVFPDQNCGEICVPATALGDTGRRQARLALSATGVTSTTINMVVRSETPQDTPLDTSGHSDVTWFIIALGSDDRHTGWGEGSGFPITQMRGCTVAYAGIAGQRLVTLAVTFQMQAEGGRRIILEGPSGHELTCSAQGVLRPISLEGGIPECQDNPLTLVLNGTLQVKSYAFSVAINLPATAPTDNTFNIIVQDRNNEVVDAHYGLPGMKIESLPLAPQATLAWSKAEPLQSAQITIGVTFTDDTDRVRAIYFIFPRKDGSQNSDSNAFIHDAQIPTDVVNNNDDFPINPTGAWVDRSNTGGLKVLVDDSDGAATIRAGTYHWTFPVIVPATIPENNVWYVSLCADKGCRIPTCGDEPPCHRPPVDSTILTSYAIPGFNLREMSPDQVFAPTGSACGFMLVSVWTVVLLAVMHQ